MSYEAAVKNVDI